MAPVAVAVLFLLGLQARADIHAIGGPRTTNNDDSCDIAYLPAATLLLPFFEVDLETFNGETTLFSVTNVSPSPQIARVTLWTDYANPIISFNLYLTGYDLQAINLRDVIARGLIAPDAGTGTEVSPRGNLSKPTNTNIDVRDCVRLPGQLPSEYVTAMQTAFTLGVVPAIGGDPACSRAGLEHEHAVGYATIDVVSGCTESMPVDAAYFSNDLRYDNVLTGDYQQVNPTENFAQGSPLVHIRAVPEGGNQTTRVDNATLHTNLPRTFYGRFTKTGVSDARQPLPSQFAGRWISGGSSEFETNFKIWRELAEHTGTCRVPDTQFVDLVRFDEAENAFAFAGQVIEPPFFYPTLPATSLAAVNDASIFPQVANGAVGGWVYMNLDRIAGDGFVDQGWLITSMRAEGRYSVDSDASAFGNGCSAAAPATEMSGGGTVIGPAPNTNP